MHSRSLMMASATAVLAGTVCAAQTATPRQTIELRTYHFSSEAKLKTYAGFLGEAAIPALNRAGVKPVGLFRALKGDNPALNLETDELKLYLLLPHADAASAMTLIEKLAFDPDLGYQASGVLAAPMKDPAYDRIESQLMLGFSQCPRVEVPTLAAERVLQLRIYESHNEERALLKVEMFNEGGEIALFRRCGMAPVFFGQSVAGTLMPNLTYMLGFASPADMEAAWATFLKAPEWDRMKSDPRYAETVSRITNVILRPLPGSQI